MMNGTMRASMWIKAALVIWLITGGIAVGSVSPAAGKADAPTTLTLTPTSLANATNYLDLAYATLDPAENLDLFMPSGGGPFPLIIWVHGGSWTTGTKANPPGLSLLKAGYAVASIEYRFSQVAVFPAQIYDVKAAIRWLRAHADQYKLDPTRFLAWGDSAGGHLVALLGTTGGNAAMEDLSMGNATFSSGVQAVIDWYGPTDFTHFAASDRKRGSGYSAVVQLLGCDPIVCADSAKSASPLAYVTADAPPFLIQHGSKDPTVPLKQSQDFYNALTAAGIPAEFDILDGAGHGGPAFEQKDNLLKVLAFVNGTIGPATIGASAPKWTPVLSTPAAMGTP